MIREGNIIWIEGQKYIRPSKYANYDNKEIEDIKREMNKLKERIYFLRKQKGMEEKVKQLEEDLYFWKNEMNRFDNLPSRKSLKHKTKKISENKLKELVLEQIYKNLSENYFYITKENIAFNLNIKVKDLDKIFMELNREGILSQPKHKYIHDSIRGGGQILPNESSDWGSDLYTILLKKD